MVNLIISSIVLLCILILLTVIIIKNVNTTLSKENKYNIRLLDNIKKTDIFNTFNIPFITFIIADKEYGFLLDTGADCNVIDYYWFTKLRHLGEVRDTNASISGISNDNKVLSKLSLPIWRYGKKYTETFNILNIKSAIDSCSERTGVQIIGLLGLKFFIKYQVVIDFNNGVIWSNEISSNKSK